MVYVLIPKMITKWRNVVLVIAAEVLAMTSWIVLLVPSGNMHDKYKFTP